MSTQSITKQDLSELKTELLKELKKLTLSTRPQARKLLRSNEVKELLSISSGTLQTLRENCILSHLKIGGSIYYPYDDIVQLIEQNTVTNN